MEPKKLNPKVVGLLLPLLQKEYSHFYNYKSSANWCKDKGYFKASAFYETESKEENDHAGILQGYLVDWNVLPELSVIDKPVKTDFTSLLDTIESAYNREYELYEMYEEVSEKVLDLDACTFDFLRQFRDIQVKTVAEYSDKLNLLNGVEPTKINFLLMEEDLFG